MGDESIHSGILFSNAKKYRTKINFGLNFFTYEITLEFGFGGQTSMFTRSLPSHFLCREWNDTSVDIATMKQHNVAIVNNMLRRVILANP